MQQTTTDIDCLIETYYDSRPNRDVPHSKVAVLFLASSGAGKSTLREQIVAKLTATYVCNDEVRALLKAANQPFTLIKPIVDRVWMKVTSESANHFIVFDSNLSSYYMHPDSYYHLVQEQGYRVYVIALDIPEAEIKRRITQRERADKEDVLRLLPEQLIAQHKAMANLHPNYTITTDTDSAALLQDLRAFVDSVHD